MRGFHGKSTRYPYFEGWYLKHQYEGGALAFIPAFHADKQGKWTASVQMITESGSWYFPYQAAGCKVEKGRFHVEIGDNIFTEKGIRINLKKAGMSVEGQLSYGNFHGIKGDIMGLFRFVPFMQCRHGVLSMYHRISGSLAINGKETLMSGAGYIESDRGYSFPEHYLWTQCLFDTSKEDGIMFSAADIPMCGLQFRGCICAIFYGGREYRIATYRGCRILDYHQGGAAVKQGKLLLKITRLSDRGLELYAPDRGEMSRTIKESPSCTVRYQLWSGKEKIFDITSSIASFEQT